MYKVAIVDDEPGALSVLSKMMDEFFDFEVVAKFSSTHNLINNIKKAEPDLLFLDIHLGKVSGVDIARELYDQGSETRIVFVTAYEKYAIQAFEYNIIDYLLKPVSPERLEKCIKKVEQSLLSDEDIRHQTITSDHKKDASLIRLNTQSGFLLIDPSEIVFLEADHVYTNIVMAKQGSHYVSVNIGKLLMAVNDPSFLRISRSHAINVNFLREVNRTQRKCVVFDGNKDFELPLTLKGLKALDEFFE